MELPDNVIKIMAEVEQKMDSGELKHVVLPDGQRLPLTDNMQEKFGLVNGQTINNFIFKAMKDEAERELVQGVMSGLMEDLLKSKAEEFETDHTGADGSGDKGNADKTDPMKPIIKLYSGSLKTGIKTPNGCVDTSAGTTLKFDAQADDEINLVVKDSGNQVNLDGVKFEFDNPDLGECDPGPGTVKFTATEISQSFEQAQQPNIVEQAELVLGELAPTRTIS